MAFENLSDRERQILANLVEYYISSADPVGSRVIANKFKMGLSSATIRNTLQDLEELGLVEQPHTSAGRVPTDIGYRFYVDALFKPEELTDAEKQSIRSHLVAEGREVNAILGQTARLLGEITSQLGVTIAPRFEEGRLRSIRFVPIAEGRVMAIVVISSGLAKTLVLEIDAQISESTLQTLEQLLNERLAGLTLSEIRRTITDRLAGGEIAGGRLLQLIIDPQSKVWQEQQRPEDLHVSGTERLLQLPEFGDRRRLARIVSLLENGRVLSDFLQQAADEGLVITIGKENRIDAIMDCSLVTSSYKVGGISGAIGVIGPTRMPYSKLVSVVEYTARSITEVLAGLEPASRGEKSA